MTRELIKLLGDGAFHSGEELGASLGLSRAAVWKQIRALDSLGLVVDAVRGKGYRVVGGIDLLDADSVRSSLTEAASRRISRLEVLDVVESTNTRILAAFASGAGDGLVCFAEQQTAGRGRRGRHWHSPFAANIYVSIGREFAGGFPAIEGLSLAMGVAVCEALESLGADRIGLKWPNDLVANGAKLGGLLIEVAGDIGGSCQVVVGVGVNVRMGPLVDEAIDQAWSDLEHLGIGDCRRNAVAAALLNQLVPALDEFARDGLTAFLPRWERLDVIRDQEIRVIAGDGVRRATARGIDASGALIVEADGVRTVVRSGEVSVRGWK